MKNVISPNTVSYVVPLITPIDSSSDGGIIINNS